MLQLCCVFQWRHLHIFTAGLLHRGKKKKAYLTAHYYCPKKTGLFIEVNKWVVVIADHPDPRLLVISSI